MTSLLWHKNDTRNYEFYFLQGKESGQLKALPFPVSILKVHRRLTFGGGGKEKENARQDKRKKENTKKVKLLKVLFKSDLGVTHDIK